MIEEVARLWLRVNGEQAIPVFTHNEVNYQSEQDRLNNKAIKQQFIAQLIGLEIEHKKVVGTKREAFSVGGDNPTHKEVVL